MGGTGSGSWCRLNKKPTEQDFWRLSVSSLKKFANIREGQLSSGTWQWSCNGEVRSWIRYELDISGAAHFMRVIYTNKTQGKDYDYKINLSTSRPNYGGIRWWFHCPAQSCGRRVGVLYLGHIFACRHCLNMSYSSQNEAAPFRMLSRAQKIHQQLGGDGCVDEWVIKPKGMHWKTYNRKREQMQRIHKSSFTAMAHRFGISIDNLF